jgi:AraC family transcriptional regulator
MRRNAPLLQYQKRVNRVENYIALHLEREFDLDKLAAVAGLSGFYFHRLFKAVTGQSLYNFIRRLRVERAATLLLDHAELPIGHIAAECGFNSQAVFCRSFYDYFSMTAREWRRGGFWWFNGKHWDWRSVKPTAPPPAVHDRVPAPDSVHYRMVVDAANGKRGEWLPSIKVAEIPGFYIAYTRAVGAYSIEATLALYERFLRWIDAHGLVTKDSVGVAFGTDNHNIVAPEHCRYDIGLVVGPDFQPDYALDVQYIPSNTYVIANFTGHLHEEPLATEYLWKHWIPSNKLEGSYGPVFRRVRLENCKHSPRSPDAPVNYQICIPVKRAGAPLRKPDVDLDLFQRPA